MFGAINLRKLITSILIPLGVGFLASLFTRNAMNIYQEINQPPLTPPGAIFPIVWTVLYILMGVALYRVRSSRARLVEKQKGYRAFALQLIFNFLWSIIFFNLGAYTFAAIWLVALIVLILINIIYFYRVDDVAAYLLLPYLIWCLFALYLNIAIAVIN